MQPSLQHGGQNGGPTSCECHELFSSQNALTADKSNTVIFNHNKLFAQLQECNDNFLFHLPFSFKLWEEFATAEAIGMQRG